MDKIVLDKGAVRSVASSIDKDAAALGSISTKGAGGAFGSADVEAAFATATRVQGAMIDGVQANTSALAERARAAITAYEEWDAANAAKAGK
ncbi:hypothetical protein DEI99_006690 [Curtobacterium sp. MCLR17_036]|uniref:hypothetical protein n=1 Tax=Curtobacterium sp. MCLR17_036 TaxID=2175620 RepID=UPI000DA906B0|nr:hypothetical protein [Curtobacterium sp. MCLR17_036]WIE66215.1 hypothetical protein DEI99_006690 [Curtobacterium sp. MCLR17_036]